MTSTKPSKLSSGIVGLDEILLGGFLPQRSYLIRGGPGAGKTTVGMHFLQEGLRKNEPSLYISLEESEERVRNDAALLGIHLEGLRFLDLSPTSQFFSEVESYDIFSPAEVEREPVTKRITATIEQFKPTRVFLDPISQLRYLSTDIFQFRKQVLSFLRYLLEHGATVLFTSEGCTSIPDDDLQFMADGILELEQTSGGRTITVRKYRGSQYLAGAHSMKLDAQGLHVFPKLIPEHYGTEHAHDCLPSGIAELDALLHGGIERGTVTFITGPTGVGKTTLGLQFIKEGAARGERSAVYLFDEEKDLLLQRAEAVKIHAKSMIDRGILNVEFVNPLQLAPDEFSLVVRREVEERKVRIVMIDSVQGYKLSIGGDAIEQHLYALTRYLQNMGVATFLIVETAKLTGDFQITDLEVSYMADNILFLRYLELKGELRRAIGVLKKRLSDFEKTLREFTITKNGIVLGQPLVHLRGILTGTPTWVGLEDSNE